MESIRAIKENPELAKELAEALLPYILQREEFRLMVEVRDRLAALVESTAKMWEAINRNSEEIKLLRQESVRVWEVINRHTEEIKLLREETGKVWEEIKLLRQDDQKVWEEIKLLRQETNRNAEEIRLLRQDNQKVWEEIKLLREESRKIWERIEEQSGEIRKMNENIARLNITVNSFTGRAGVYMERTMLELYREALRIHGVDPSRVKKVVVEDKTGVVAKGRRYEVDMVEEDGVTYLFEIKNYADSGALEQIDVRRRILEAEGRKVKVYLVANMVEDRVKREAEAQGITVIAGTVVEAPSE